MVHRIVLLRHGEDAGDLADACTGWDDVDLTALGEAQATEAGAHMKEKGLKFQLVITSVLRRSIRTAWKACAESENFSMHFMNSWRLNDGHYGSLQGLTRSEAVAKHGDEKLKTWLCSCDDAAPPEMAKDSAAHPLFDPLYASVPSSALPNGESFKQTVARVRPVWFDQIGPVAMAGKCVLVAAHERSLRALCKLIEGLSDEDAARLDIVAGVPLVYELDDRLTVLKKYYVMDPATAKKKTGAAPGFVGAIRGTYGLS